MSKTLTKSFSQMSLLDIQPLKPLTVGEYAVLTSEMTQAGLNEINRVGVEAVAFFDMLFQKH